MELTVGSLDMLEDDINKDGGSICSFCPGPAELEMLAATDSLPDLACSCSARGLGARLRVRLGVDRRTTSTRTVFSVPFK